MLDRLVLGLARAGLFRGIHCLGPPRLTVLAYHRIASPSSDHETRFLPNISATPQQFARQLEFLSRCFNLVPVGALCNWLDGHNSFPPRSALITFDDGYADNLTHGLPVLRQRAAPGLIFLTSGHVGTAMPLPWDLAAYCFGHTAKDGANLPLVGQRQWQTAAERDREALSWVEQLKVVPHSQRLAAVESLPDALDVSVPASAFSGLYLTWDGVRTLLDNGVDVGAHTVTHPILTRMPSEDAHAEIRDSKRQIADATGEAVESFAYPNGMPGDYDGNILELVRKCGFQAAFTLVRGQATLRSIRKSPFTIRRVLMSHKDNLARFAVKTLGLGRM